MILNVHAIEKVLSQFERLKKAAIDTCSILYADNAGFFPLLSRTIVLCTIPEIVAEVGSDIPNLEVRNFRVSSRSTDQKLVRFALFYHLPVISEDSKILRNLKKIGHPHFNALMMLNLLLHHGLIDEQGFIHFRNKLEDHARYDDSVWQFGQRLFERIVLT